MKRITTTLLALAAATLAALGDELKTTDGKVHRYTETLRVEPDGIVVMHAEGVEKILFAMMPADAQVRYHYDPAKAAAWQAVVRATQARVAAAAAQQQAATPTPAPSATPKPVVQTSGHHSTDGTVQVEIYRYGVSGEETTLHDVGGGQ